MHKYMHQVVKTMDQRQLYEARWMEKPTLYNVVSNHIGISFCHIDLQFDFNILKNFPVDESI